MITVPVSSTALGKANTPPPAISPIINTAVVHIVKPCISMTYCEELREDYQVLSIGQH